MNTGRRGSPEIVIGKYRIVPGLGMNFSESFEFPDSQTNYIPVPDSDDKLLQLCNPSKDKDGNIKYHPIPWMVLTTNKDRLFQVKNGSGYILVPFNIGFWTIFIYKILYIKIEKKKS